MIIETGVIVADSHGSIFAPGRVRFAINDKEGTPGTILEVGPASEITPEGDESLVDLGNSWLIPGLIQSHVHLNQTLFRGMAEGFDLLPWLKNRIWPLEAMHDEESVRASACSAASELLLSGATAFLSMETTRYASSVFQACDDLGIRGVIGTALMDLRRNGVPADLLRDGEEALVEIRHLDKLWRETTNGRLRGCIAPRFVLSCSKDLLLRSAEVARENGMIWHSHAAENRDESELVRQQTGKDNIVYLYSLGLLGERTSLAHAIHLNVFELKLLGETRTNILHCPSANLKLASGVADSMALHRWGANLALGSDGAPCNNRLDLWEEMRLAALLALWKSGGSKKVAELLFGWATAGGAKALGLEEQIGKLETGFMADMVALDDGGFAGDPADKGAVYTHLVFSASSSLVRHVWVGGRQVVAEGKLLTGDLEKIRADFRSSRDTVLKRGGL